MIVLRLFAASDPFTPIAARVLTSPEIVIGRDPAADWPVEDPEGELSRRHCMVVQVNGHVYVRDTSLNGVWMNNERIRAGEPVEVAPGGAFQFGPYFIQVDQQAEAPPPAPIHKDRTAPSKPATDASLLEHFCVGAGIEPSAFLGEDLGALMRELGGAYRTVVDELSELLRERAAAKRDLHLDRTTIGALDNNPLKWAPPERVAADLLLEETTGFLKAADAFRASFNDLRAHHAGLRSSQEAAVQHILEQLDPDTVEAGLKRQPLGLGATSNQAWKSYRERYGRIAGKADASPGEAFEDVQRAGYQKQAVHS
jgi:type VI secretion system protein ImpI